MAREVIRDLNKETMRHFVDFCPECDEELKKYSVLPALPAWKAYCPECDILRTRLGFSPYLCDNCHSTSFYVHDRIKSHEIENQQVKILSLLIDRKKQFNLSEDQKRILKEKFSSIGKEKPKDTCWFCGDDNMTELSFEVFHGMESNRELKLGYDISNEYGKVKHKCDSIGGCIPSKDFIRHNRDTYYLNCIVCLEKEYLLVPEWQQKEIERVKGRSDVVSLRDLSMVQPVKVTNFSDENDLFEKVLKDVKELGKRL